MRSRTSSAHPVRSIAAALLLTLPMACVPRLDFTADSGITNGPHFPGIARIGDGCALVKPASHWPWRRLSTGVIGGFTIDGIINAGGRLVACGNGNGAWWSDDGNSWTASQSTPTGTSGACALALLGDSVILADSATGLFSSVDHGKTFSALQPPTIGIEALAAISALLIGAGSGAPSGGALWTLSASGAATPIGSAKSEVRSIAVTLDGNGAPVAFALSANAVLEVDAPASSPRLSVYADISSISSGPRQIAASTLAIHVADANGYLRAPIAQHQFTHIGPTAGFVAIASPDACNVWLSSDSAGDGQTRLWHSQTAGDGFDSNVVLDGAGGATVRTFWFDDPGHGWAAGDGIIYQTP